MIFIGDVIEKEFLVSLQKMLVQSSKTFVCIYERDGSCLSLETYPSFVCPCSLKGNDTSCCDENLCCQLTKLPIKVKENPRTIRVKCSCGVDTFIIPIRYDYSVIGYMSVGVSRLLLNASKNSKITDSNNISFHKKLFLEHSNILKNQLKEACKIISKTYGDRCKYQIGGSPLSNGDFHSLLKSIITDGPACVTVFKKTGANLKVIFANKHTTEYFRAKFPDGVLGKSIKDLLPQHKETRELHFKAINSGKTISIKEFLFNNPFDNQPSWWNISVSPYYKKGKIIGSISIRNEITEYVLARKKLEELSNMYQEKSSQLEAIIDNMSEGLIFCDKEGNYLFWNKAAYKLLDIKNKVKKIGQTKDFFSLTSLDGKVLPAKDYPIQKVFKGASIKDLVYVANIGNNMQKKIFLLFNGKPIFNKNNNFMFGLITFRDITQIKEQGKQIEEQWDFINRALDQLEAPVYILTYPDLKFVLSNKQMNYLLSSLLKRKINKDNISNENVKILNEAIKVIDIEKYYLDLGSGKLIPGKIATINLNIAGHSRYFSTVSTPIQNSLGETTHIIFSAFETTNSVVYSKKLEEISRLKEEFFANVSHEFRTPLTVILGALQMLNSTDLSNYPSEQKAKFSKYLSIMKQNCNRLVKLINNLLDVTRIHSGYLLLYLQDYDIVALSKEITMSVSDYASQKKIELKFSSNVKSKKMPVDIDKIERILLNLLSNAVKFTPEGKKITVSFKDKGEYIEIHVKDTGVGIPPQKLDIIFERFRQVDNILTRKNEGTGLGLSLVKSLVEMHGGKIKVKSRVGAGTEFIITLPANLSNGSTQIAATAHYDRSINEVVNIEFSDLNL